MYVTSHIQNVPLSVPFVTKDFVPNDVAWDLSKLIIHFHFCVLCMHAVVALTSSFRSVSNDALFFAEQSSLYTA